MIVTEGYHGLPLVTIGWHSDLWYFATSLPFTWSDIHLPFAMRLDKLLNM